VIAGREKRVERLEIGVVSAAIAASARHLQIETGLGPQGIQRIAVIKGDKPCVNLARAKSPELINRFVVKIPTTQIAKESQPDGVPFLAPRALTVKTARVA